VQFQHESAEIQRMPIRGRDLDHVEARREKSGIDLQADARKLSGQWIRHGIESSTVARDDTDAMSPVSS
jgi:hypothetical protein